ncbi:MAG: pyridoxal 5'-phosphate synthase glutaminase subunit PdxT [Halobacteriaceae archaeon]
MSLDAGVIAVQGDISEHAEAIQHAGKRHNIDVTVHEIREAGIVPECDVLLMPGGESTTISRLLQRENIDTEIKTHVKAGKPVLATCAGLIVAATDANDERVDTLDIIDVSIQRNAFGRQVDSFEAPLPIDGFDEPFPAVFIRAPIIDSVGDNVDVLARWEGDPVAVRDGPVIGTSFHPELTGDSRIHDLAFFDRPAQKAIF